MQQVSYDRYGWFLIFKCVLFLLLKEKFLNGSLTTMTVDIDASAVKFTDGNVSLIMVIVGVSCEVSTFLFNCDKTLLYKIFYIYLFFIGLMFYIFWFLVNFSKVTGWLWLKNCQRNDREVGSGNLTLKNSSDKHLISMYLRIGTLVFGVLGMINDGIMLVMSFSFYCTEYMKFVAYILSALFRFFQMAFIFRSSGMAINRLGTFTKFGLMHNLAVNLIIGFRSIVMEEKGMIKTIILQQSDFGDLFRIVNVSSDGTTVSTNDCENSHEILSSLRTFFTTCELEYSLICAITLQLVWMHNSTPRQKPRVGKIVNQKLNVDCSSSTKGLMVGLLFLVVTIVSLVLFFILLDMGKLSDAILLFYINDAVVYMVCTGAVVVVLFQIRRFAYVRQNEHVKRIDDILLSVGLLGQLSFCLLSLVLPFNVNRVSILMASVSILCMVQVLLQTALLFTGRRMRCASSSHLRKKSGRQVVAFLIVCNLSIFLINTFQAEKAALNSYTADVYNSRLWTVVLHSTIPLRTFFRFHSSVCLAEMWTTLYRQDFGDRLKI
ncbi:Proton channel OtopLc [Trichinella spiralis]|uniref:Proton channel OtopLc n=1 Tax=Trichinella spiralis TaxID=6334 RepID=A0ABR3KM49_TRISP